MKKITFSIALSLLTFAGFTQKTILVNGGEYGNPSQNVNVNIYDASTQTTRTIDTIHTQSVQDILVDGNTAFVAAQDSIVKYDLISEQRLAAVKFPGVSTKTMALSHTNELIVSNWYGKSSFNLYVYDPVNLNLIDSIDAPQGVNSLHLDSIVLGATQNQSTGAPNYQDTLGSLLIIDVPNRSVLTTVTVPGYSGDFGEIIPRSDRTGLYTFNSVTNSINVINYPTQTQPFFTASNVTTNQNFKVGNTSQYSVYNDTAFLRMNQGIGAYDINTLTLLDSNIVDTVVTAFTFDTLNQKFYVTQTDFFSYTSGKVYDRNGNYLDTIITGFSPEVITMYYNQATGVVEYNDAISKDFELYPNPASDHFTVNMKELSLENARIMIFAANGQQVLDQKINRFTTEINTGEYEAGIYFVSLQSGNEIITKKLIVH